MSKKKSPAQLNREINEALSARHSRGSLPTDELPAGSISKDEMIRRGADGHLSRAFLRYVPIQKLEGLEPVPAASEGMPYIKGRPITQPIEVRYDAANDYYIVAAGNHRVAQAKLNRDSHILAFVEPDLGEIGATATRMKPRTTL
jgi:hypothetical protein